MSVRYFYNTQYSPPAPVLDIRLASLGDARQVQLYEVDIQIASQTLPGVIVIGVEQGEELILGRNVFNKLDLRLEGPALQAHLLE